MHKKLSILLLLTLAVSIFPAGNISAQNTVIHKDSALVKKDSLKQDSIKVSEYSLKSKVTYTAKDSIRFNIAEQKVYLFGTAEIKYEDIDLTANYIEIYFKSNTLYAKGIADSTGKFRGTPVFTQGSETFSSATLTYNFKTKKAIVGDIVTKEGDSYLSGKTVKYFPDKSINIKNGFYTTCSEPDPHYEIKFSKARVIPDNKIVTGPAYLVIEDVPTPLAVPFGLFPNKKGQKSGILFPSYGESANRGFFLENGGYYAGLGDHMDLAVRGDIYSRGSWALRAASNYNMRYKYSGLFSAGFTTNITGQKGAADYQKNKDFFVKWTHTQDPKVHPNSRFSANVDLASSKYNTFNPATTQDYVTNTLQSNVSFSTTMGSLFNFSVNMRHSQNTITKDLSLYLPELAFSVNRIYPFKSNKGVVKQKWYDNINLGYTMNAQNYLNTKDTLLFHTAFKKTLKEMQNGVQHSIPISWSGKVLKNFTWTNSASYTELWYLQTIRKHWFHNPDTSYLKTDTMEGFASTRYFSFTSALNTRLYGMLTFKKGKILAIRHVFTPSVSFQYQPDFGSPVWGYYRYLTNEGNLNSPTQRYYSIFDNGIYGKPPSGKSGSINMNLANNLEMKVRNYKDTVTGTKKIVLIDNFTISGGYNLAADSMNLSKISMNGRTKLFKNLDLNYSSVWDPYVLNDSTGININKLELSQNKRLFRLDNTDWSFNLNWALHSKTKKKEIVSANASPEELAMIKANPDKYVDFDQQWSLNLLYTLNYSNTYDPALNNMLKKVVQTLAFNGDINITDKWKFQFTSGYDFQHKGFAPTSVNIYRDMHCWEMIFTWIPIGYQKSYNLTIRVKSTVLQDLKLTKKKDFRDDN